MAAFRAHLIASCAASGFVATCLYAVGAAPQHETPVYFAMGVLGGALPDIDADDSIPNRILFSLLGLIFAFLCVFSQLGRHSIAELFVLWLGVFIATRYIAYAAFTKLTTHRGIFHSIPAGFFFCFAAASISHHLFYSSALNAWMNGLFVLVGYLLHLLLDELFSVDLSNAKVKKTFGSALKIISTKSAGATLMIYLFGAAVLCTTPSTDQLIRTLMHPNLYKNVKGKLLPRGGWFEDFRDQLRSYAKKSG